MKSYPSTLNESMAQYGGHTYSKYSKSFDIERLNTINLNTSTAVIQELLKPVNINIANFQQYSNQITIDQEAEAKTYIENHRENPSMLPYDIIALMKDYEWEYNKPAQMLIDYSGKGTNDIKLHVAGVKIAPSMFNPMYGVNVLGMTSNVPLLNGLGDDEKNANSSYMQYKKNLTVCTIRELCSLSNSPNSILGMAKYKYADFMYCKDLGKVSNNYLITLRRFAHPVDDHIFELSNPEYVNSSGKTSFLQEGDIGRLVTWFGTEDNKLEDIIKFSYHTTWQELGSQIEEKSSEADNKNQGLIGMLANTVSAPYQEAVNYGVAGEHNIWTYLGGKIGIDEHMKQGVGMNNELLTNYDKNRVYSPKNTIQKTHIYEGKIEFTHEFTLVFSYKLRAYDNINPKSAFLDLLGNILEVTGRRGRFWGGQRKLIGPPVNEPFFNKAEKIIDNQFDKIGGIWDTLSANGFSMDSIMGLFGEIGNKISQQMQSISNTDTSIVDQAVEKGKEVLKKINPIDQAKAYLKNALGRPKKIAWQSLLDGSNTGVWHVTIGNPKNPIMVMGNLIVTDSNIQQSGPLGLDDFPTNLKVSITLKHARPRDITDISKMYTKGMSSIYLPLASSGLEKYLDATGTDTDLLKDINKVSVTEGQTSTEQNTKDIKNQSSKIQHIAESDAKKFGNTIDKNVYIQSEHALKTAQLNNFSPIMAALAASEVI